MKTIMRYLIGVAVAAAAALGTARPQSAAPEIRLSDIKAQQPQETIFASAPCQRARESPRHMIVQRDAIDPKTLVPDLNTLMEMSEEVILAGTLDSATVISPSGESTATYEEVRVIRSWKGPHHAGDTLTFGWPGGHVRCEPLGLNYSFSVMPGGNDYEYHFDGPYVHVLFLRQSNDNETQSVQGLRPVAGEGMQGIFPIKVPHPTYPTDAERYCADVLHGSVQHCDTLLQTSQSPVVVPYAHDPLAKKYGGMPASVFLQEVQSVAAGQAVAKKSSQK